jgi:hypothetical protein
MTSFSRWAISDRITRNFPFSSGKVFASWEVSRSHLVCYRWLRRGCLGGRRGAL